jgi:hypothetical protein
MRRTQVYLSEEQYRWLKREAGRRGSIASVLRDLIDRARNRSQNLAKDPLARYLLEEPPARGKAETSVSTLDEDIYRS